MPNIPVNREVVRCLTKAIFWGALIFLLFFGYCHAGNWIDKNKFGHEGNKRSDLHVLG